MCRALVLSTIKALATLPFGNCVGRPVHTCLCRTIPSVLQVTLHVLTGHQGPRTGAPAAAEPRGGLPASPNRALCCGPAAGAESWGHHHQVGTSRPHACAGGFSAVFRSRVAMATFKAHCLHRQAPATGISHTVRACALTTLAALDVSAQLARQPPFFKTRTLTSISCACMQLGRG